MSQLDISDSREKITMVQQDFVILRKVGREL